MNDKPHLLVDMKHGQGRGTVIIYDGPEWTAFEGAAHLAGLPMDYETYVAWKLDQLPKGER